MSQQPAPALPTTDWFRADAFHPALPGYYQVRGGERLPVRSRLRLVGVDRRFWNGSAWLTWERGEVSVFGLHDTHQWCGQRRWVLSYCDGGNVHYCVEARRAGARWSNNPQDARPFFTAKAASRFAARYSRLRLTPVLA